MTHWVGFAPTRKMRLSTTHGTTPIDHRLDSTVFNRAGVILR